MTIFPLYIKYQLLPFLSSEWTQQIVEASTVSIPVTNKRTIPHIKQNNSLKRFQRQHKTLLQIIQYLGKTFERQRTLQALRNSIKEEYKQLNNEKWNNLIENTDKERNGKDYTGCQER